LKDDELKGSGNSYDFGARIYDPRTGRFLSLDPRMSSFPFMSAYCFAANSPLRFIDVDGEGPEDRIKAGRAKKGTAYKQQTEDEKEYLRTGNNVKSLEYMDCSEFICRVLAEDALTDKVDNRNTTALIKYFGANDNWETFEIPKAGDVVLWEGWKFPPM